MKTCPKCRTENPQEANFCRHCGSKFEEPKANEGKLLKEKSTIPSYSHSLSKVGQQLDIEYKVKEIIADKLGVNISQVIDDANFAMDLNADSLDTVELIMAFEEEFGIVIPDEDTQRIATVKDAINYIQKKCL